jgi:hypothetical protein
MKSLHQGLGKALEFEYSQFGSPQKTLKSRKKLKI